MPEPSNEPEPSILHIPYPGWIEPAGSDPEMFRQFEPGPAPELAHYEDLAVTSINCDDLYVVNEIAYHVPLVKNDVIKVVDGVPAKLVSPTPVFLVHVYFQDELMLDYPDVRLGLPTPRTAVDERNDAWVAGGANTRRTTTVSLLLTHHDRTWISSHVAADPLVREVELLRASGQEVDLAEAIRRG